MHNIEQAQVTGVLNKNNTFGALPAELLLNILDQLVRRHDDRAPLAYSQSDPITKTLRSMTLVSRTVHIYSSEYLHAYCAHLDDDVKFRRFCSNLRLNVNEQPHHRQTNTIRKKIEISCNLTSTYISPIRKSSLWKVPSIRLSHIENLCRTIGQNLRRLAIDLNLEIVDLKYKGNESLGSRQSMFKQMPNLEELICSELVLNCFPCPPPHLKKLATTCVSDEPCHLNFCFGISSLNILFLLRPQLFSAGHIDKMFRRHNGRHIDIVLVAVNIEHGTPPGTRDWQAEDAITIWEVDVPKSYYGDQEDTALCVEWMWTQGVQGTLWDQEKRKMLSWKEMMTLWTASQGL